MLNKKIDLNNFDFEQFKKEAIDRLKSGESLTGKEGILTPLLKEILEAALEGEMDAHLSECRAAGLPNRRNGKLQKTMKTGTGTFELTTPRECLGKINLLRLSKNPSEMEPADLF